MGLSSRPHLLYKQPLQCHMGFTLVHFILLGSSEQFPKVINLLPHSMAAGNWNLTLLTVEFQVDCHDH